MKAIGRVDELVTSDEEVRSKLVANHVGWGSLAEQDQDDSSCEKRSRL
jgi:hypothetical protein